MIWADYAILAIVGVSALISLLRGFVREALSLLGWVLAFWVALSFTGPASALLSEYVAVPSVRQGAAFVSLFVGTLLITALVVWLASLLVDKTGLTGTDRMLGVLFGAGRGVLIVAVLVLLAGLTGLPADPWWRESLLIPHFERLAGELRTLLPPEFREALRG